MNVEPMFSPCGDHQSLLRMPEFARALEIASACDECYIDEVPA